MITPKQKTTSLPTLIKEADAVFSQWIRYRDMKDGKIECFICGAKLRFAEAQAMHFIDRDQMPTRYSGLNVHSGCENCNCYDPDHHDKYRAKMILTYGEENVLTLEVISRRLQKFMRFELENIILNYKNLVSVLKKKV